jgi:hypothetical protein
MNMFYRTLLVVLLIPTVFAASDPTVSLIPQPRVRLQPSVLTSAATSDSPRPVADNGTVLMDKVTVTESKLPKEPRQNSVPEPTSFSFRNGGPLREIKLGGKLLQIGLWSPTEVFVEDAGYRGANTHCELQLVRVRW